MTGTEQKTPLGGSEAGGSDGLYAVLPLRDIVVFPHMIVPLLSAAKNPFARWRK